MSELFTKGAGYEVICALEQAGYEAVFVGGAVRDYLLGNAAKDIDVATSAEPYEVKAVFRNTIDVGIAHGTILVLFEGEPIEVTTFRTEGTYTDHRRPDKVQFVKSLHEDLLRRDFTMNAIALTKEGQLVDPFGGREDMENHCIRAVGNPADRFKEDALRMLRAIRFSSVLNFTIEKETLLAICNYAEQIRHVSIERLKIEMDKLFMGMNPVNAFQYMGKSGLDIHLPLIPSKRDNLQRAIPFATAVEGWVYLTIEGEFHPSEMAKVYKLSNNERHIISSVIELYEKRTVRAFTIEDYYLYELDELKMVEKFFRTFQQNCSFIDDDEIEKRKTALPIHSIKDLAVNGTDLIQWAALKGGQWTGEWIKKIEFAVLHQTCKNEPTQIKEWFCYEFNREN
ncbi:CCA tRNA nucleotidyltransferase [Sporosarcina sp. G11-34]|uniref:CCA tRNA nucleotidyltransferase n=1 Tax=Sporosarcina sp. G11-34 TaxID=2849605 RepID=UPI0022A96F21|nr:CCA tRNA nucleotidyltransferase [Sporosarcina sp. G11-34]MCZ2259444.1 CCA tRNA nucleotidyltransferase [Sporosarcina sp. G11-34]